MLQRGSRVTSAPFSCPEGGGHLYPVSNAFLNAVKANTRKYYWTGRITTTAGTVYEFDQDDMVKGSEEILMLAVFFIYRKKFNGYNKHDIQLSCCFCYDMNGV